MENYIKTVLYAYPLLKTVGEDYAAHIRNKAVLSYNSRFTTEKLAEYLAEEILRKNSLVCLKEKIDSVLHKLSDMERELIAVRYFGKRNAKAGLDKPLDDKGWNERKYFRFMQRLSEKIGGMLKVAGVTREFFEGELLPIEVIGKIHRFVEEGKEKRLKA